MITKEEQVQIVNAQKKQWEARQYALLIQLRVQKKILDVLKNDSGTTGQIKAIENDLKNVTVALDELKKIEAELK